MKSLRYIFLIGIVVLLFSCKKFSGSQEIPAYLRLEPWIFTTNYDIECAPTEKFVGASVYVDDNLLGVFEINSHQDGNYSIIPVLAKGSHKITLRPIINLNGISSTKVDYPCCRSYVTHCDLVEGQIDTVMPRTSYYSIDSSYWNYKYEDFEEYQNIKFTAMDTTGAVLEQISHRTNSNAWIDPKNPEDSINHYRSAHIHLGDSTLHFATWSTKLSDFAGNGKSVLVELDYKCTAEFGVGLYIVSYQDPAKKYPLYYFRPSDTWNKVYINLGPTVTDYNSNVSYYRFYIDGEIGENETADYYFDNIKLIYVE